MPADSNDIWVSYVNLGGGQVVLDMPAEALNPPERRVLNPRTPYTQNYRLRQGVAQSRPGYTVLSGTAPDANKITGLYDAVFDNGDSALIRATKDAIYSYVSPTYTDRTDGANPPTGGDDDYWDFAMVPRAGSVNPKNLLAMVNGVDEPFVWDSVAATVSAMGGTPPIGGKAITSFLSRCFIANHLDGSGNRRHARISSSVAGGSEDWTGLGASSADLGQDPYPIGKLFVMAGGLVVLKGNDTGGSIWRGTPTGILGSPVRYDAINPGQGVGLLLRRTAILLDPGRMFFVGHDGIYLYDGVQALRRVAEGLVTNLLARINQDALDAAFAWYKARTGEIHISIPVGASSEPNETWVYNLRDDRVYGPYLYDNILRAASAYVDTGDITWLTFDYPGGWTTIPFATWTDIAGTRGDISLVYGTAAGDLVNDRDDRNETDDGTAKSCIYYTPGINAADRVSYDLAGNPVQMSQSDMLTLREVVVEYKAAVTWTPTVTVFVNGASSGTVVSDGTPTVTGEGELRRKHYTAVLSGQNFTATIEGSSASPHELFGVHFRFTPAGDERAG